MQELQLAGQQAKGMLDGNGNYWVEWVHEGTAPAKTIAEKALYAATGIVSNHCSRCLNLNGCRFLKSKMPEIPLHPNCHCEAKPILNSPIPGITAIAECDIRKFTDYIFHEDPLTNKGKKDLFESWGYDKIYSEQLQAEIIKQAQEKYANGEYELGKLDFFGQRINITIVLLTPNGKIVSFRSGCMVYPDGRLKITTPYGGKIE